VTGGSGAPGYPGPCISSGTRMLVATALRALPVYLEGCKFKRSSGRQTFGYEESGRKRSHQLVTFVTTSTALSRF